MPLHVALVVTAAPIADRAADIIRSLHEAGHRVTVYMTAHAAADWQPLVGDDLAATGRTRPDAVIVCPATFNTLNKWAAGINDSPVLGILNDALGLGTPILAVPMVADRLASHPAWGRTVEILTDGRVRWLNPATGQIEPSPTAHLSGAGGHLSSNFQAWWLTTWLAEDVDNHDHLGTTRPSRRTRPVRPEQCP